MKIVVTHHSPDWDAITSVWLIKKFLPEWHEAAIQFVPAGERLAKLQDASSPIEKIGDNEVIHVDTGLGPLDHHQTQDKSVCGASLTFDYVKKTNNSQFAVPSNSAGRQNSHPEREKNREEALSRIVRVVVDIDHFKEVFWENPTADYHEFSLLGVLEGLKLLKPDEDMYYIDVGMLLLDALLHNFENRIWAEKEIAEKGIKFIASERLFKGGCLPAGRQGMGFATINDTVLALSQKMGYAVVIRKDPRKGYIRIKARPKEDIDLTLVYEKLKKMDPAATWFLHISKKMLLNGTVKNPTMKPTTLTLEEIIKVLERI